MSVFKERFGKVSMLTGTTTMLCLSNLNPKLLCWLCKVYNQHCKFYSPVAFYSSRYFLFYVRFRG